MSKIKAISGLSEAQFKLILGQLLNNQEFRKAFFEDPKKVMEEFKVRLTKNEIDKLLSLKIINCQKNIIEYNEKLVLCSSSGY